MIGSISETTSLDSSYCSSYRYQELLSPLFHKGKVTFIFQVVLAWRLSEKRQRKTYNLLTWLNQSPAPASLVGVVYRIPALYFFSAFQTLWMIGWTWGKDTGGGRESYSLHQLHLWIADLLFNNAYGLWTCFDVYIFLFVFFILGFLLRFPFERVQCSLTETNRKWDFLYHDWLGISRRSETSAMLIAAAILT